MKARSGQESVWDYPRPPRVEQTSRLVRVVFNGETVAESTASLRVLETSHPPTYYFPPGDVRLEYLNLSAGQTMCEFKGMASYYDLRVGQRVSENAVWSYANPRSRYGSLKDHIAFYPGRVDACYVGGEQVVPQSGDFYGGWVTPDIVGPFKGEPGTERW